MLEQDRPIFKSFSCLDQYLCMAFAQLTPERWNKSLATLRREQQAANGDVIPPKVPHERKRA